MDQQRVWGKETRLNAVHGKQFKFHNGTYNSLRDKITTTKLQGLIWTVDELKGENTARGKVTVPD